MQIKPSPQRSTPPMGRGIQRALELHPQRTNTVIQIIFEPLLKPCTDGMPARVRASSRGVLVDGAGVAPAPLWLRTQEVRVALGSRPPLLRRAAFERRPVRF